MSKRKIKVFFARQRLAQNKFDLSIAVMCKAGKCVTIVAMNLSKDTANPFIAVLKIADFRNLWLSQVISQVFLNVLIFTLVIRTYELTQRNTAVAGVVLMASIPNFLFGAIAGVFVDRWDRKLVMFMAHFLRIFVALGFLLFSSSIIWLYVLMFLTSLLTQFFQPAEAAMIGVVVPDRQKLLTANSIFSVTLFSSVIVGNVLSGPSLKAFGAEGTFIIVAAAFGLAALFTSKISGASIAMWAKTMLTQPVFEVPIHHQDLERETLFEGILGGLDYLHHNTVVRHAVYLMVIGQVVIQTLAAIATGFANKVLLVEASDVSLIVLAPAAAGMVAGAIIVGQYFAGVSKQTMIKTAVVIVAALLLVFAFVDKIALFAHAPLIGTAVVMLLVIGAANAFLDIPLNTIVQESAVTVRSRIYGVSATLIGAASVVPILLAGTVGDVLGVRFSMALLGLALVVVAIYYSRKSFKV